MRCTSCGFELKEGAKFCPKCGEKVELKNVVSTPEIPVPSQTKKIKGVMTCSGCGAKNKEGTLFCSKCGRKLAGEGNLKTEERKKTSKVRIPKFIPILAAVVLVAVVLVTVLFKIVLPFFGIGSTYKYAKHSISCFYDEDAGAYNFVFDGKILSEKIYADDYYYRQSSLDGSVAAVVIYEDGERSLYCINEKEVKTISESLLSSNSYALSATGSGIAYIDEDNTLYLYNISDSSKTTISNDVYDANIAISPDGKIVLYSVEEDDNTDTALYVYEDGNKTLVGKNLYALAVSDKGKYIYSYNYDSADKEYSLYLSSIAKEKEKISGNFSLYPICFNEDFTEILFSSNNKTYICVKGGEKQSLFSDSVSMVLLPIYTQGTYRYSTNNSYYDIVGVDSLLDCIYVQSDNIFGYDRKEGSMIKLASNCNDYLNINISFDGSKLVYISSNDSLRQITVGKSFESETLDSENDVEKTVMSPDGKYIYYVNEEDELWCKKGNSDAKKIADDVETIDMAKDGTCYFINDYSSNSYSGTLYSCANGKDKTKIADDVYQIDITPNEVFYMANCDKSGVYDVYLNTEKNSFEKIATGVSEFY